MQVSVGRFRDIYRMILLVSDYILLILFLEIKMFPNCSAITAQFMAAQVDSGRQCNNQTIVNKS